MMDLAAIVLVEVAGMTAAGEDLKARRTSSGYLLVPVEGDIHQNRPPYRSFLALSVHQQQEVLCICRKHRICIGVRQEVCVPRQQRTL